MKWQIITAAQLIMSISHKNTTAVGQIWMKRKQREVEGEIEGDLQELLPRRKTEKGIRKKSVQSPKPFRRKNGKRKNWRAVVLEQH